MSIVDARQLDGVTELDADICIVGAGAAGITVAAELNGSGREVLLVESGHLQPDEETQGLYDLDCAGYPVREDFMSRARYFGGSCNLWAGRSMKLTEADFARRDWVPASGWPLPYADVARHYPRAASILRLPPLEMFDWTTHATAMSTHERALFSHESLSPRVSLWARRPMRFGAAYHSELRGSRDVRILLNANVTRIVLNQDATAVESLEVSTLSLSRLSIRARVFVLACGAIENARLLLVSRDSHASGVGNQFDLVGRYFMDHPRCLFGRMHLLPQGRLPFLRGRPLREGKIQIGIGLSNDIQRREGLLNHYATLEAEYSDYAATGYQTFVKSMKVLLRRGYSGSRWNLGRTQLSDIPELIYLLTPKELLPHWIYRIHASLRRMTRFRSGRSCVVVYFCEQPPDPESRVTLSSERDRLGMNKVILHWRISPEVTEGVLRLQSLLARRSREAGIGELLSSDEGEIRYTDASHHMGTTRMSQSPRDGVVDTDCRVHGVRNLFLAGSSVFPSAGHANPTLTIVAVALRLADKLKSA